MEGEVIDSLKELKFLQTTDKDLIVKARYGPSIPTKIPIILEENLSCFVAAIIGDGHLTKNKALTRLDGFNKGLISDFEKIAKILFDRSFGVYTWKEKNKERYCLRMDSLAIFNLLNKVFEIPKGNKSNIVRVPKQILQSNASIKSAFLIGLLLTEGGKRRRGFGLSTSSKGLWEDLIKIFEDINLKISKDKWIYKKYQKEYYGLSFVKDRINIITQNCKENRLNEMLIRSKNFFP